ncbi:solute:sodium symporter family transporter [Chitinophaga sp. SYP-B3965]|uniref:solute:sodium symporter family transporter n=1 Tax=Chitinophaga sp. SYP-B3965 TaxID=2663120 RepID=UPI0012996B1B|nr:solute:sodium symporter family transporter [Chitinophaga sp. SYP-B3965]MRG47547.1 solute:sodium symporter family transporter [Chitinophaga sp. SYP-B3965]
MNATTFLTFFLITITIGVISWYKTRSEKSNTIAGFFLANRNLGFISVGSGLLFANINTVLFVGENELVFTNNLSVMAWGMTSVIAMLAVSEFIMPIYLRTGIATTPDYLEKRYDSSTKKIVSLIFLVNYIVNLLPSVLYGGAVAFNGLFHFSDHYGIDYWTTIWILVWMMGSIGGLYCILGGLRAIAISDVLLGAAMFTGGILLPWFGLRYLGNGNISEGLAVILSSKTEHMKVIGAANDAVPFSTIFTGMLLVNLYYWGTEQYTVQQVLGSRNLAVSQKGIALAAFGKILSPLLINLPGLIAVHMYSSMQNTAEVFPRMVSDVSPPLFVGYMAAILFGATFTTFNAGLNSASTLFILNVYKSDADEKKLLRIAKKFEIVICLLAMFIAPFIIFARGGFYNYLQMIGGFFSVPIFTIILIGFLTRRVPAIAAKVGLVFFIVAYGATQVIFDTGLHFLHVLALLFVITSAMMLIIGRIYPMKVPYVRELSNVVDIVPWKGRHIYSALLIMMVVAMYVVFTILS